ncbi:MAG: hypothetical protein ACP5JF_00045 [Candidatus Methanodesulfokora sp.]
MVGFALVVMLLSTAGVMTPPSIGMKQDPSQDFVDFASSINTAVSSYSYLRGTPKEKLYYLAYTLQSIVNQYYIKGIYGVVVINGIAIVNGNYEYNNCTITTGEEVPSCKSQQEDLSKYLSDIIPDINIDINNYNDDYGIFAIYYLMSKDGSSNFTGMAASNPAVYNYFHEGIGEGAGGGPGFFNLYFIPPGVYYLRPWLKKQPLPAFALFFVLNPNKATVDAIMRYYGEGNIKWLKIRVFKFPGDEKLIDQEVYGWDKETNSISFSLDPFIINVKKTLDLKYMKIIIGHKYNVGIGTSIIIYGGDEGQIGTFHIDATNGYLSQDVLAYYNDIKGWAMGMYRGFRGIGNLPGG